MNKTDNDILNKYYTDIHRLPLDRFINVTCDGDLSELVISGQPSKEQLNDAWKKIIEEYNMAMTDGTPHGIRIVELHKRITSNIAKLQILETLIPLMEDYYTPQFARDINAALSTQFSFDPCNRPDYIKTLKRCKERSKGIRLRIVMDESAFKNLIQDHGKKAASINEKPTRQYFSALLVNLSDFAGYNLKESEMTVGHFVERLKRYNDASAKAQAPKVKTKSKN